MVLCLRTEASHHVVDQGRKVVPAALWTEGARLHTRQVEKIAHDAAEPTGLLLDVGEEALALRICPEHVGLTEASRRSDDRRERRAKVVGDRAEERVLESVGTPQNLGVGRALTEAQIG